jgi:hypothetical protein
LFGPELELFVPEVPEPLEPELLPERFTSRFALTVAPPRSALVFRPAFAFVSFPRATSVLAVALTAVAPFAASPLPALGLVAPTLTFAVEADLGVGGSPAAGTFAPPVTFAGAAPDALASAAGAELPLGFATALLLPASASGAAGGLLAGFASDAVVVAVIPAASIRPAGGNTELATARPPPTIVLLASARSWSLAASKITSGSKGANLRSGSIE